MVMLSSGENLRSKEIVQESIDEMDNAERELYFSRRTRTFTLEVTNLSFNQPFSPFFVMVHNRFAAPLFVEGENATLALALLAENGDPQPLVDLYTGDSNVLSAEVFAMNPPYGGGAKFQIPVTASHRFPLITIASMAINTNDCFVALNGFRLRRGYIYKVPGWDSGSEVNNELCESIPGPGCANVTAGNIRSGEGEGFVHVHRGFFGVGDLLPQSAYDWRNPMMKVRIR